MRIYLKGLSKHSVFILFFLSLCSCTVGPNYLKPSAPVSPQFKEAKGPTIPVKKGWKLIKPLDAVDRGEWWTVFNDPVLNDLETELNKFNLNIGVAEANYRQSLAIVDVARSNYFPVLAGTYNIFRQKAGGGSTSFISTTGGTTTTGIANTSAVNGFLPTTSTYSSSLNATWEPDIWGLVRRTVEADVSAAQSNVALVSATRLSAQGALAQYYFELRTLDSDQKILDNTVASFRGILKLTQHQYASGIVSRGDVLQAQSQLETAQAQALNNGILRAQYEHAIAVLMGRPPALLSLQWMPLNVALPIIPISVPSALLERRPDIAQAERLIQEANALIGVAVAAYYPNITLTGTASAAGRSLHKLIHTPSLGWSLGLQLAETIFDGGLRSATVRAAKASYESKVATYRQTVLTAFQDVEDNLVALRILREQTVYQDQAALSAEKALRFVLNQYKAGTVAYSDVLIAQITAYTTKKSANDVRGLQMTAAVGLIKALGGGWNVHDWGKIE